MATNGNGFLGDRTQEVASSNLASSIKKGLQMLSCVPDPLRPQHGDASHCDLPRIVRNTLTDDFFCSDPALGATGACGA